MTLGRTSSGAIKIKTDGTTRAVNCACCGGGALCGPISFTNEYGYYVPANSETSYEISNSEFDNFQLGGTINWSSSINIDFGPFACDFSYSNSISIPPNTCTDGVGTYIFRGEGYSESPTCINDCSLYGGPPCPPFAPPPNPVHSETGISVIVFSEEGKYYLYMSGYIMCPIGDGTTICSGVYKNAGKNYSSGDGGSFSLLGVSIGYDTDSTWSMSFSPNPPN